jgi:hypothetical protein
MKIMTARRLSPRAGSERQGQACRGGLRDEGGSGSPCCAPAAAKRGSARLELVVGEHVLMPDVLIQVAAASGGNVLFDLP